MENDASIGSINFQLKGSADEARKSIDGLTGSLKGVNTALKAISVVGLIKGFKAIGTWIGNNISKTSEYIAAVNKFNIAMGASRTAANQFVNRAEKELGLDPQKMMESVSSIQLLAEGFGIANDKAYIMSKNLSQLAADMTAFGYSQDLAMQKVKSGLAGEIEPMRAIGVALDKNTLQQVAYANGINMSIDAMTRAQKTELIYYQIMTSTQRMQGMLAKSTISPQVAIMQLKNEFLQLARAIGSVFIPIAMKIIPVVRAITQILTQAAQWLANLFGFKLGDYTVNVQDMGASIGGIADNLDNVGGSARKATKELQKMLMPFDELNNVNFETGSGSGSGGGSGVGGVGGDLGLDLPQYDMFEGLDSTINDKVEAIKRKFEEWLPVLRQIAEIFAAIWAIKKISDFVGALKNVATNLGLVSQAVGSGTVAGGGTGLVGAMGTLALAVVVTQEVVRDFERVVGNWQEEEDKYRERTGYTGELSTRQRLDIGMNALGSGYISDRFGENFIDENDMESALDKVFSKNEWKRQTILEKAAMIFPSLGYQLTETLKGNQNAYEGAEKLPIVGWGTQVGNALMKNTDKGAVLPKIAQNFYDLPYELGWGFGNVQAEEPLPEMSIEQVQEFLKLENPISKGINKFIKSIENLGNAFKDLPNKVKDAISSLKDKLKSLPNIFQSIKDKLVPKVTEIKDNIVSKFGETSTGILQKLGIIKPEGTQKLEEAKNSFSNKAEETKNTIVGKWEETKNGILGKLGLTKSAASTTMEETKNEVVNKSEQTRVGSVGIFGSLANGIAGKMTEMRTRAGQEAENVRGTVKSRMSPIATENQSIFEGLKNGLLNSLAQTSSGTGTKMNEIKGKLNFAGFNWQLPTLKTPHFSWSTVTNAVTGAVRGVLSAIGLPISLPKLNVSWFAEGGFPDTGSLFVANEAGAELVGNIGRRTAVANNDQITQGIATATYQAISRALQENNRNGQEINPYFNIQIGDDSIYSGYATRKDRDSNRYGVQL